MPKIIEFEFSPNGILGRVFHRGHPQPDANITLEDSIVIYPGVFLGLPFDVHMPRGIPVFGPDVPPHTAYHYEHGKMETTLPETPPATEDTHHVTGGTVLGLPAPTDPPARHASDCDCPYCYPLHNPLP